MLTKSILNKHTHNPKTMTDLKTPYLDKEIEHLSTFPDRYPNRFQEYQQIKAALKRLGELEYELKSVKEDRDTFLKAYQELEPLNKKCFNLQAENKELKKRLLTAIEFVHSLAAGFPMGFWRRTRRAGEVLKKINP